MMTNYIESKIIIPFSEQINPQNLEKIESIIKHSTNVSPNIFIVKKDQFLCKYDIVFSINVFIKTEDFAKKLLEQIYNIINTEICLDTYENELLMFHFSYDKDNFTFEEYQKYF